ncbi:MAG: AAA family ATPase [Rhodospirillaceae bacterium]|nr:AAA family ATPase [Rhodospirillaceae bacterium]
MSDVIETALEVAKQYPVFPTRNKKPALSNRDVEQILGRDIGHGEGGFKMATIDPHIIEKLFDAAGVDEIAVPMGPMSGLICVDVDSYKDADGIGQWVADNARLLEGTLTHTTRSGGAHYIFRMPEGLRHMPTLRPGVDLKGNGGYICWPGTPGYEVVNDVEPLPFPMELLSDLGGEHTANPVTSTGWNNATDAELIAAIHSTEELYPALRTLAWRMAGERAYTEAQAVEILDGIMDESAASSPDHSRHEDWLERKPKIPELVASAWEKHLYPLGPMSDMALAALADEIPMFDVEAMLHNTLVQAPKLPGPEVEAVKPVPFEPIDLKTSMPRQWLYGHHLIKGFVSGTVAPGGTGKSSLAMVEALAMAAGKPLLGDEVYCPLRVLYWCGEDPMDELAKRFSAAMEFYGLTKADLGERLFVLSGRELPITLAKREQQEAQLCEADLVRLNNTLRDCEIDVVFIDPFISVHRISENSNEDINLVLEALHKIADEEGIGIELVHHSTKEARRSGGKVMGAEQARGASAFVDAARSVRVLSHPTKTEVAEAGWPVGAENDIVKIRAVKGNMSRRGNMTSFRMESVKLDNGTEMHPAGDEVGVAVQVEFKAGALSDYIDDIFNKISAVQRIMEFPKPWRSHRQADDWLGTAILADIDVEDERTKAIYAKAMLERLVDDEILLEIEVKMRNGKSRPCYKLDEANASRLLKLFDQ